MNKRKEVKVLARDNNDQNSLTKKILGIGAIAGGAIAFNRLGGQSLLADIVPKANRILKNVADDLSVMNRRDFTGDNIGSLYRKHFSGSESTMNRILSEQGNKIDLPTSGNGAIASIVKFAEISANQEDIMKGRFYESYRDIASNYIIKKHGQDDLFNTQIKKLTDEIVTRKNLIKYQEKNNVVIDSDVISKHLDIDKIENKKDFFDDLLSIVDKDNIAEEMQKYKNSHYDPINEEYDFIKNMLSKIDSKSIKETYGTNKGNTGELRGMTFGDFVSNMDSFKDQYIKIGDNNVSVKNLVNNFLSDHEDIMDVLIDSKNLKMNSKNEIVDLQEYNSLKGKLNRKIAGTLPGKILKTSEGISNENIGPINIFRKGTNSGILSSYDENSETLNSSYMHVLNKLYRINDNNTLSEVSGLTGREYFTSTKYGTTARLSKEMFMANNEILPKNKLAKFLDIGTTTDKTLIEEMIGSDGIVGKIARKVHGVNEYNIVDNLFTEDLEALDYRKNLKEVSRMYSKVTQAPSAGVVNKIKDNFQSESAKKWLDILSIKNDEDMLSEIMNLKSTTYNEDLMPVASIKLKDRNRASRMISVKADQVTDSKQVMSYGDIVRREVFKEALINESMEGDTHLKNYNRILEVINKSDLKGKDSENINNLITWTVLQNEGKIFNNNKNEKVLSEIIRNNKKVIDLLTGDRSEELITKDTSLVKSIQENLEFIKNNYTDITTKNTYQRDKSNYIQGNSFGEITMMRKGYSAKAFAMDIIKDLNDTQKLKANAKNFGMQFVAGRNNPEYMTNYTMIPYFFAERLASPFKKYGLGFSSSSNSDFLNLSANIFTKRILPVAAGVTAFSYLNYEAKNLTGTSITGAMAQGIANVDLGLRKVADITGIGGILNYERSINPISRYWLGDDYQDSSERKNYYENGYDAVRKSRWWSFGSASEFRGGKISYYQPNFVKRANSNWKDEGLYGGSDEKWKHSWVPTPRHPLAPLRRLANPYWLEQKHYYDRPYMQTAPLFSQGTPWGAVLNPTIGEIVKPVRRMHRNETRRGLTDPRTLIAQRNSRIKAKAVDKDRENIISFSYSGVDNVSYTPTALAEPGKAVVSLNVSNGKVNSVNSNGIGYAEGLSEINNDIDFTNFATAQPKAQGRFSNLVNAFESTMLGSAISNNITSYTDSKVMIAGVNAEIKNRAKNGSMIKKTNLANTPMTQAKDMIATKQDESDLLLTTSRYDFISDTLFSGKQLSGIYGFIGDTVFGSNRRKARLESANNMTSFTRGFWDSNIGGLGGGIMEIARRFFPHQDRSWTEINPIRNTMPEWMPERFKIGDPFTKVQKGEMRLPGQGYESIHKLRSDEYGRYGALDRMRILGDIAPWSDEYKVWRDIAQKSIQDKAGKQEIKDIKKRVEMQSKNHDFYNYRFLNNPTDFKKVTVDRVEGTSIVTTEGQTFSLAGIKLKDKEGLSQHIDSGTSLNVEFLEKDRNSTGVIQAAVYKNGININKTLVDTKMADKKDDGSAMSAKALIGQGGQVYGSIMEAIGHAPIPFIHSKLLRIETPLESYKNERVYGSSYSTWDHPIKGFVQPAFQKAWGRNVTGQALALGAWGLAESVWGNTSAYKNALGKVGIDISETALNKTASIMFNALNPGAFAGAMMGAIPTGLMSSEGLSGLLNTDVFGAGVKSGLGRNFARAGATAMIAGYGFTRADNPIKATGIFSVAGMALANQLKIDGFDGGRGALAGAAFGLALSSLKNPGFDKQKMFGDYIPEDTKKRRDIEEYYDRLEYIKYTGLFNKASRKARLFEGVNISKILRAHEYKTLEDKKELDKINIRMAKISNSRLEDSRKQELIKKLSDRRNQITNSEQLLRGGKYTKAAIAYKQAAESTIYGLRENATAQQVLRAIPKAEKDYFMEFIKEKDPKAREKILKYISPYQKRALQIAWGEKNIDEVEDNSSYFRNKHLPGVFWAGWSPTVDLENVKIKTIENEGMLLSDFGIYESQRNEPSVQYSPTISDYNSANSGIISLQAKLQGALNGSGLIGTKVSVSPSSSPGIEVVTNIVNGAKITEYKVREGINKMFGTRMFY